MALAPETVLQNRYRIVRQIGKGGMGTVYEAYDQRLGIPVALKEMHFIDERSGRQFEREARLLARLRHPALIKVMDHFTEGDGQFLAMEFIEGPDMLEMLQAWAAGQQGSPPFPTHDVLGWADQLLDVLAYLHSQTPPVIHRDIKPQNLKLTPGGQIILLDFGLAKGFSGQTSLATTGGSVFGYTPNYASLEQIQGTGTDPRSDLYSLGATLYSLLTATIPPTALARASALVNEEPDPLRPADRVNPGVSAELAAVLHKAMAQSPNKRFAGAAEMRERLREAGRGEHYPAGGPKEVVTKANDVSPSLVEAASQEASFIHPTITQPDSAQAPTNPTPTVPTRAMRPVAAPTLHAPQQTPPPSTEESPAFDRPARKSKRLPFLLIGLGALLVAAVVIAFTVRRGANSAGAGVSETSFPITVEFNNPIPRLRESGLAPDGSVRPPTPPQTSARPWALALWFAGNFGADVVFSPEGKLLALSSGDTSVKITDPQTKKLLKTLSGHTDSVSCVAFSPDGRTLVSGSADKTLILWDVETGDRKKVLEGHKDQVMSVAYSPDGKVIASGAYDLKLWDARTGELKYTIKNKESFTLSVSFSPDGNFLAGTNQSVVRVWDMRTGEQRLTLDHGDYILTSVTFSPDSKLLATGSISTSEKAPEPAAINLWDLQTGAVKRTIEGHTGVRYLKVAFSPDGKTLVSNNLDNMLKVWDVQTGGLKQALNVADIYGITFSPDGKTLAGIQDNKSLFLWTRAD